MHPAVFIGHGSPMNAIENNEFTREWERLGRELPVPEAIVCISAHWVTSGIYITAMDEPRTIHDFYGFPEELYQQQYPAPGSPVLAQEILSHFNHQTLKPDLQWGYDHGCWTVAKCMYPDADIPMIQISLNANYPPEEHFSFARQLHWLRERKILVLGSGNIVHNLGRMVWTNKAHTWAAAFDNFAKEKIEQRDFETLIHYNTQGEMARLSVPTNEHYLPLLYILALVNPDSTISFFNEKVTLGAISMRGLVVNG